MASEDDARPDDKGSDSEGVSLGQALSSLLGEAQKTLIAATRDAASQLREMADEERKKREEKNGPEDPEEDLDIPDFLKDVPPGLHETKESLFDWVRLHQPNIEVDEVVHLTNMLWGYYTYWLQYGSESMSLKEEVANPNEQPLSYANQIADIIVARCRAQGVGFEELPRILANSSSHAGRLYDMVKAQDRKQMDRKTKRDHSTALRLAATLRDSLDQAARLMEGEELDEPDERIYHRTEKTASGSITQDEIRESDLPDDDDTIIVYHGEGSSGSALRMGYVYKEMKEIRAEIVAAVHADEAVSGAWSDRLQQAMDVIKGDIDVPNGGIDG